MRQKKKKTPEIEPETHQNQADPEGVAYVSVSFTKTTRTRDQVKGHDDEVTAAIYSIVKAPPPSSSSDHHDFFTTVNKLKRRRMVQ
ncbi:hypothetical protein INR49_018017 [Caranx melampygus]|nr:hypothetical protein INR49_018017 [Caranx melampygus]